MTPASLPPRLRSLFISDVHLGTRACQAGKLLDFLRRVQVDNLFLVGDIIDLWSLRKNFFWPSEHSEVIREALRRTRTGTQVIYVPGNHDALFRELDGATFGNLEIHRQFLHTTADGRRLLVCHGDEFDSVVKVHPLLAWLGSTLYDRLVDLNPLANTLRGLLGFEPFSLAAALKTSSGRARRYIANFETAAAEFARRNGVDGIICGHLHQPALRPLGGSLYVNDGDWVESCTALAEQADGTLSLLRWDDTIPSELPIAARAPIATSGEPKPARAA